MVKFVKFSFSLSLSIITIGILHSSPGQSQTSPQPAFEVASIKPSNEPCCRSTWESTPGGTMRMTNQTLKSLIRIAY